MILLETKKLTQRQQIRPQTIQWRVKQCDPVQKIRTNRQGQQRIWAGPNQHRRKTRSALLRAPHGTGTTRPIRRQAQGTGQVEVIPRSCARQSQQAMIGRQN
jgi:hypothetical protein